MRHPILIVLLIFPCYLNAQEAPLNAIEIEIKGITFKELVNRLLDSNYSMNKIDSNFQYVETAPIKRAGATGSFTMKVRVKDSSAFLNGTIRFGDKTDFRANSIGWHLAGSDYPLINSKAWKRKKYNPFKVMNNYALSFGKPISYKVKD